MPHLSNNGVDLHYAVAGDGPPLLMIAGFGSDGASWAPVAPAMSQNRRLIMPDNRGCGQTRSAGPISLSDYADDCLALLDHLGLRSVDIVGHSMGGAIAMDIASSAPNRVRNLVLSASVPRATPHARTIIESLTALREAGAPDETWFRQFFCWLFSSDFFEDRRGVDAAIAMAMRYPYKQTPGDMRRQTEALKEADLTARLGAIKARTMVLACENDLIFPLRHLVRAYEGAGDIEIRTIPDAAHSLHWDRPEQFVSAVNEFLGPN